MLNQRPYCCGNCPSYLDQGDGVTIRPGIDNKYRRGECRKNPPAIDAYRRWPAVSYLDFCAEHPSAPLTRQEYFLVQINSRLESHEERGERVIRTAAN
jgi:hypothetical protein